jgi:MFS family permease
MGRPAPRAPEAESRCCSWDSACCPCAGSLYTLTNSIYLLVAIQVLDGIGAGIFGVVSVLVVADLTRGTGRFNLTLGAIATAVGIRAALSQTIAGAIVHHFDDRAGFVFLASVAAAALLMLWFFMPETLEWKAAAPARGGLASPYD